MRIVKEDLLYIKKQWKNDLNDDELRRDCVVLRRLLIDDYLGRAWRELGFPKQPRIVSSSLQVIGDKGNIFLAQAGGALYKGLEVRDIEMGFGDMPKEPKKSWNEVKKPLFLSDFLASTCMIVKNIEISRHDVITYVANTLGGVHLDWDREFKEKPKLKVKYEELDKQIQNLKIADKKCIYYELLAIGQNLTNSHDIPKLIKKMKEVIKNN